jgi:hypothetical protein
MATSGISFVILLQFRIVNTMGANCAHLSVSNILGRSATLRKKGRLKYRAVFVALGTTNKVFLSVRRPVRNKKAVTATVK